MKQNISIILLALMSIFFSCSNGNVKDNIDEGCDSTINHMSFMGVDLDGKKSAFLKSIQKSEFNDSLFGCLDLKLDDISNESFTCSYRGYGKSKDYAWFEFTPDIEPYNNNVVYLHGQSILNFNAFKIVKISLIESLGNPKFDKHSLTEEVMEKLDIHEAMVYKDIEAHEFFVWERPHGYVILQYSRNAEVAPALHVELGVVDKANFNLYIDKQLEEQNEGEKEYVMQEV